MGDETTVSELPKFLTCMLGIDRNFSCVPTVGLEVPNVLVAIFQKHRGITSAVKVKDLNKFSYRYHRHWR